jgi:hypothetical protein
MANIFFFGGGGTLRGCAGVFCGREVGIQVLAGLAPSFQTVGSLLRPLWPPESSENVSLMPFTSMEKSLNYFPSTTFGHVKNMTNLPITTINIVV